MRDHESLVVSECYGPTWQGEGPSLGRLTAILRLGRCNLACEFCDTQFTWNWETYDPAQELHDLTVDDVVARLDRIDAGMVVVTGGEPLLQQRQLSPVLAELKRSGRRVEIETAGTIAPALPEGLVDQWNVSPKLANSGNPLERRYKPDVLQAFEATGRAVFKFVACEPSDLEEVAAIVEECGLTNIWIMPEGTDARTLLQRSAELADDVLKRGWNLSTRLHILLWGDRRGV